MSSDQQVDGQEKQGSVTELQRYTAEQRAMVRVGSHGIHPANLHEMSVLSQTIYRSGLAPESLNKSWEQVFIAVGFAMELGLPIISGIQNIAVINGRASLWGDSALALCQSSDLFDHVVFDEEIAADHSTCTCRRNVEGAKAKVRTFTLDDAKKAGLFPGTDRQGNVIAKSPWNAHTKRMLQMRARMWCLRDTYPEVLKGMRSVEEVRDDPERVIMVDAGSIQRLPGETKTDHLASVLENRNAEKTTIQTTATKPDPVASVPQAEKVPAIVPEKTEPAPTPKVETPKPKSPQKTKPAETPKPSQPASPPAAKPEPAKDEASPQQLQNESLFTEWIGDLKAEDATRMKQIRDENIPWSKSKGHLTDGQAKRLVDAIDAKWKQLNPAVQGQLV